MRGTSSAHNTAAHHHSRPAEVGLVGGVGPDEWREGIFRVVDRRSHTAFHGKSVSSYIKYTAQYFLNQGRTKCH